MVNATRQRLDRRLAPMVVVGTIFCGSNAWCDQVERKVCAELLQKGLVERWTDDKLFYRRSDRAYKAIATDDTIPHYVDQLYYFTRTQAGQEGAKSVLNWKFVYTTTTKPSRTTLVGLSNDRWTAAQLARSSAACANVSVEGYDNFHFYETSNICLRYHFHQQDPDTLATAALRRSFAFGEMVPSSGSNLFSMWGSFISPAKATTESSTILGTLVKSWIKNFTYEREITCVAVTPYFPGNAKSLRLQVVNHGTQFSPDTHDWRITFQD